ncbi:hypothetical protein DT075_16215 [Bacillus licheniformis]|nr:hypothetical protein DT075_16215 [Bacillus licheniformis]
MYEGTNVRSGPSTSSAIVKRTGKGESYPIVSEGSGAKQSQSSSSHASSSKSGTVGVSTLNVRSTASHQGRIIATLQRNASVTILNEQHGWYEIEFNGGGSDSASGKVTSSEANLRIRKGPGTSYEVQGVFPEGEQADLLKTDGKWIKISYQNITGWVYSDYVNWEAVIATDEINVRSGPGLSHEIVSVVSRNESYPILEERGDWVQIQLNGGQKGWVVSWLIKKKSQVSHKQIIFILLKKRQGIYDIEEEVVFQVFYRKEEMGINMKKRAVLILSMMLAAQAAFYTSSNTASAAINLRFFLF